MLYKIAFVIYTVCAIGLGISYYSARQTIEEQNIIIKSQNTELAIKQMEIETLTNSVTEQNSKIDEYKNSAEEYAKQIAIVNSQLELEIQKQYMREHIENQNSSDKEAIEWLRVKRNSISF